MDRTMGGTLKFAGQAMTVMYAWSLLYIHEVFSVTCFLYIAIYSTYCLTWAIRRLLFVNKHFDSTIDLIELVLTVPLIFGMYWVSVECINQLYCVLFPIGCKSCSCLCPFVPFHF